MACLSEFMREWADGSPFILAKTSGSTGEPKTIRLLKTDMMSSAEATNRFFKINSASVLAIPLSMDYIAGKMMAVRSIAANCRLVEMPVSNNIDIDNYITLLSVVPTQLDSLLSNKNLKEKVDHILIGGAPLSHHQEEIISSLGISAWLGYGMTETCSHVALRKVGGNGIFQAMDGIAFKTDERDCLVIESDRFSWRKLTTNDVVELISSTEFRWVGRADNTINSGGLKLHPEQLEEYYRKLIVDMPTFFLTGQPDAKLGQAMVMVAENPPENLLAIIRERIEDHRFVPKRIVAVDRIPRTANGKILRKISD